MVGRMKLGGKRRWTHGQMNQKENPGNGFKVLFVSTELCLHTCLDHVSWPWIVIVTKQKSAEHCMESCLKRMTTRFANSLRVLSP